MTSAIRLVLFDLDETLCSYDRDGRIAALAERAGLTAAAVRAAIWESGFEDDSDRGALTAEAYLEGFGRRLGIALSRADWIANRRAHSKPRPAMLDLVRRVQRRAEVAVFTQNGALMRESFAELFPEIAALFGPGSVHLCCEVGALKSEPEAYLRLLARLGHPPGATLFVDDVADYVAIAEQAGLHGHHFTGLEGLSARLQQLGLLP
jgi:putative hydrolase of the HAD superfamily